MSSTAPHNGSRQPWESNGSRRVVVGRALAHERARLFAAEPLCRTCARAGRAVIATIRDHVVPLAFGGADERANTQPLCRDCHDAKTAHESAEGQRRAKGLASKPPVPRRPKLRVGLDGWPVPG